MASHWLMAIGRECAHSLGFRQSADPVSDPANSVQPNAVWVQVDGADSIVAVWVRNAANTAWARITSGGVTEISDITGLTAALNGKANVSHTHAQSDVTNLVVDLAAKAPLVSPALTGVPTAPTAAGGTNTTQLATTAFVQAAITASGGASTLDGLSDVAISSPVADQVIRYNGSQWVNGPSPSSGAGSALYTRWDPFVPDSSPDALTEEFTSTSLANFTQVNTGTNGTVVDADTTVHGALFLDVPTHAYRMRALLKALPAGDFTIHTAINFAAEQIDAAWGGIILSTTAATNSGTQTMLIYGSWGGNAGYGGRGIAYWSTFGESATGNSMPYAHAMPSQRAFLRLRRVGSTYYFAWSIDGETWLEKALALNGGMTPSYFGLFGQAYAGSQTRLSFPYLRYYPTGTQLRTGAARNVLG